MYENILFVIGSIMFHVRRRPADYHPRKRKKKPTHKWNQQNSTSEMLEYRYEDGLDRLPFFLELNAGSYSNILCNKIKKTFQIIFIDYGSFTVSTNCFGNLPVNQLDEILRSMKTTSSTLISKINIDSL
jgi:hypothetical protein